MSIVMADCILVAYPQHELTLGSEKNFDDEVMESRRQGSPVSTCSET